MGVSPKPFQDFSVFKERGFLNVEKLARGTFSMTLLDDPEDIQGNSMILYFFRVHHWNQKECQVAGIEFSWNCALRFFLVVNLLLGLELGK